MAELAQGPSAAPVGGIKAEGFADALHRVRQVSRRSRPREGAGGGVRWPGRHQGPRQEHAWRARPASLTLGLLAPQGGFGPSSPPVTSVWVWRRARSAAACAAGSSRALGRSCLGAPSGGGGCRSPARQRTGHFPGRLSPVLMALPGTEGWAGFSPPPLGPYGNSPAR